MGQIQDVEALVAAVTKSMSDVCEEIVGEVQLGQSQAGTEGAVSYFCNPISTQFQPLHLDNIQHWHLSK